MTPKELGRELLDELRVVARAKFPPTTSVLGADDEYVRNAVSRLIRLLVVLATID